MYAPLTLALLPIRLSLASISLLSSAVLSTTAYASEYLFGPPLPAPVVNGRPGVSSAKKTVHPNVEQIHNIYKEVDLYQYLRALVTYVCYPVLSDLCGYNTEVGAISSVFFPPFLSYVSYPTTTSTNTHTFTPLGNADLARRQYISHFTTRKHQVVMLDHGLYRQLSPVFRYHFASIWRALFLRDDKQVKYHSEQIGMGDYWRVMPLFMAHRLPGSNKAASSSGFNKQEQLQFQKEFGNLDLASLLSMLPPDLAFILKYVLCPS